MEELVDEILISMTGELDDKQLKLLQATLIMKLNKYDFTKKVTEIVAYEPDDNEKYIRKWIAIKKINGCTKRTLDTYYYHVNKALGEIGKNIFDITTDDIRLYMAKMQMRGVTPNGCNCYLRCLSSFFNFLRDEGTISKSPTALVPQIKGCKIKKEAFTEIEVEKLRNEIDKIKDKCVFELLLSTGCRVTELCQIKIDEIRGDEILVHGKGQKDRIVYLNAKAKLALNAYLKQLYEKDGYKEYLFPRKGPSKGLYNKITKKYDSPKPYMDASCVEGMLRRIAKKAGIENVHPHKFRRTCATFALRAGMPIEQVSKMLGHNAISTTQIYLDLDEKSLKLAHEKYVR